MTSTLDVPAVDRAALLDVADPYPTLAEWRSQSPLLAAGPIQWLVTRHADVDRLLKDRRAGHHLPLQYIQFALGDGAGADFRFNSIVNRDAPDHTRLRRLMSQAFSRSLVLQMRSWVTALVDGLLAPLRDGAASFDVVDDLAFPLPTQVICELLGIPLGDRDDVRLRATDLVSDDRAASDSAVVWMRDYLEGVLTGRRRDPAGDLLERMLAAEDGADALTHDEIVDNAVLLFVAGFETTKHLIASGVAALLADDEQRDRLWAAPSLAATATEELLRFDPAAPQVVVMAREPIEIGGHVVPADHVLHLLLASANRDERVFHDPSRLDIGRDPNPHVAFGGGLHLCLGAMLARLEGQVVFERLATLTSAIEPDGLVVRPRRGAGSLTSVPIRGRAR